jgi:hypothetical protein
MNNTPKKGSTESTGVAGFAGSEENATGNFGPTVNRPRMFAYLMASFTLGVIVYIFTGLFIPFTETPGWVGTAVLMGYGLVYASVMSAVSRRFIRKSFTVFHFPYALIPMVVLPAIVLSELKSEFATIQTQVSFGLIIVAGAVAGVRLGVKAGHRKRDETVAKIRQEHGI